MRYLFASLIINSLALYLTSALLPGVEITGFWTIILGAVVLSLINAMIRPLLFLFTLPINILTLGLFTFFVIGLSFWFASTFVPGFYVNGIWWAILGGCLMGILNAFLRKIFA